MKMSLQILRFPKDWNNFALCDQPTFVALKCGACANWADGDGVAICTCHRYCQVHCAKALQEGTVHVSITTWRQLLRPYVGIAPSSTWNAHVLNDLVRKLNLVDESNLTCLLGLLVHTADDDVLCRLLLELGVDPEMRYLLGPAPSATPFVKVALNANAIGGTAVHFAALYGRPKCLRVLIDAGCDINAINSAGKSALDLAQDQNIKNVLTEAATNGRKSLAQLAKEGLFFAICNRIRTSKVDRKELLTNFFEGKCVIDWLNTIVAKKHVIPNDLDAPMFAQQVLTEMQYRYEFRSLSRLELLSPALLAAAGNDSDGGTGEEDPSRILYLLLEGISTLVEKQKGGLGGDSKKDEAGADGQ